MLNNEKWFTEAHPEEGIGFGLQIRAQLHTEVSSFQTIAVYDTTHFGHLLTLDGVIMLTTRDNFLYHEMISHPVLFTHPHPNDVVIIGGGDCGTLQAVLKHPVQSVTQIEIDERVTRLSERYFPELCTTNTDKRATLLFIDGIRWMQEAPTASCDIIIVDSTDPIGPAEGLFNQAFYRECHRVLRKEGLLVQQSESPLIHQPLLKAMREAMVRSGFSDLLTLPFPQPVYPSGWHSVTLAAKAPVFPNFRRDNALLEKLQTKYYQFAIHEAGLTPFPFLSAIFK
jgi:spermidine synthase